MLAIGAGGLDVAVAMGGGEYYINMPKIVKVNLTGKLGPWVTAKDIILEMLRRLTVKGGVGKIFEYTGEGVNTLSVPERATITNMGAELGATTSLFPSDDVVCEFLKAQGREGDFSYIKPDADAVYDEEMEINLSELEPMVACPHSPDKVVPVSELKDVKVNQVCIGSCTNSSYVDMMKVAHILEGKTVNENVSLTISPGSKQVLNMISENGGLASMVGAGARILESACGPCIGMGQSPATDAVSLRTFNRNFEGRSGTKSAMIYLVSPEIAAASALKGYIADPREIGDSIEIKMPDKFLIKDNMIVAPSETGNDIKVVRGPNIKPFPKAKPCENTVPGVVLTKVGDNITTDHIMPSNAKLLPYRSNIPHLAEYCLTPCDEYFPKKAKENGGGFIVAGVNYGQGSSREHAALAPLYLGVKAVLAKSFARIHMANLINNGIMALVFADESDYEKIDPLDKLVIENALEQIKNDTVVVKNESKDEEYKMIFNVTQRQRDMIKFGGLLNMMKQNTK
jgi:Aconitase A